MRNVIIGFSLLVILAGCGSERSGKGGDCATVKNGHWTATGNTWGMDMNADIEVKDCAVTFSNWNMMMSVPSGATISGDTITLQGNDKWSGCTGTVQSDTLIEGTCTGDSTWGLIHDSAPEGS